MLSALGTAQGGLASSLDADTPLPDGHGGAHGVEGATYVWTPLQLAGALGEDAAWAGELLGVTEAGTFEHGASTLTTAELRVLQFLPTHLSFEQIGKELFVSRNTVKSQAIAAYRKLGVTSRTEAVERAQALGLLGR